MPSESDTTIQQLSITFPEEGSRANASAASLADKLRDVDPSLIVTRDRANPNTQDAGAILTIVLGSTPAAALAAGIAAWIRMRRVVVRISTGERSIDVSGSGADAAHIIESIFKRR